MTEDAMVVTTLRLPPALLKRVQSMAEEKGVKPSAVLRSMIVEAVARCDALKAAESDAGSTMAKKFALYLTMDPAFIDRLMEFPEFRKDISPAEDDE